MKPFKITVSANAHSRKVTLECEGQKFDLQSSDKNLQGGILQAMFGGEITIRNHFQNDVNIFSTSFDEGANVFVSKMNTTKAIGIQRDKGWNNGMTAKEIYNILSARIERIEDALILSEPQQHDEYPNDDPTLNDSYPYVIKVSINKEPGGKRAIQQKSYLPKEGKVWQMNIPYAYGHVYNKSILPDDVYLYATANAPEGAPPVNLSDAKIPDVIFCCAHGREFEVGIFRDVIYYESDSAMEIAHKIELRASLIYAELVRQFPAEYDSYVASYGFPVDNGISATKKYQVPTTTRRAVNPKKFSIKVEGEVGHARVVTQENTGARFSLPDGGKSCPSQYNSYLLPDGIGLRNAWGLEIALCEREMPSLITVKYNGLEFDVAMSPGLINYQSDSAAVIHQKLSDRADTIFQELARRLPAVNETYPG